MLDFDYVQTTLFSRISSSEQALSQIYVTLPCRNDFLSPQHNIESRNFHWICHPPRRPDSTLNPLLSSDFLINSKPNVQQRLCNVNVFSEALLCCVWVPGEEVTKALIQCDRILVMYS